MSATNGNSGTGGGSPPPGEEQMDAAYTAAGVIVREQLSPNQLKVMDGIKDRDVVVISGAYDHIDRTLRASHIPFIEKDPAGVTPQLLEASKIVFANCGGSFPIEIARHIGAFVEAGGLLISTDYMLKYLLEVAFQDVKRQPLYVRHNGRTTPNAVVDVDWIKEGDPITRGFFTDKTKPRWWLESSSYPIEVVNPQRVQVLARSSEVGKLYGSDPVIVRFPHGKGGVIHLLSHLYLQQGGAAPGKSEGTSMGYATSLGTSQLGLGAVQKATAKTGDIGESRLRGAVTSVSFVTNAVTSHVTGGLPFTQQPGTAIPGASAVGGMMGATSTRTPAEMGQVPIQQLPWEPRPYAYVLDFATGKWTATATPIAYNAASGFYELGLPESNTVYFIGRDNQQTQADSFDKMTQFIAKRRIKVPNLRVLYVPVLEKREKPVTSRVHAVIEDIGGEATARPLGGDITLISSNDPSQDDYRQARVAGPTFVGAGQRLKMGLDIVVRLKNRI